MVLRTTFGRTQALYFTLQITTSESCFKVVLATEKVNSLKCSCFVSVCPVWLYKYDTVWTFLLDWNSLGGLSQWELPKQSKCRLHTNQFKQFSVSAVNTEIFLTTSILKCGKWNQFINVSYIKFVINFLCCPAYSPVKSTDLSEDCAS